MREPAETRGAIPLYQVLVEELNHQYPDFPLSVDEIEAKREAYEAEYDAEHQHGKDQPSDATATPEAREERRKAIDYRLVREFYTLYHEKRRQRPPGERLDRSALCFSGGGIRSATFGLGVLQGLAHQGLLTKF